LIVIEEWTGSTDVKDAAEWVVNKGSHGHLDYDSVDEVAKNISEDVNADEEP